MTPLLIATGNQGKIPEVQAALAGLPFELKSLHDIPELPHDFEVEEPAMTFEGNAIIKAMTVGVRTGLLTLADDSGLEVDALDGAPGVKSARYAPGSDADRYRKLLAVMHEVSDEQRSARFVSVIAVFDPETMKIRTVRGECEGSIAREPKGEHGFGYDPVFISQDYGIHMAEVSLEQKNKVSHRGRALRKVMRILPSEFIGS